MRVSNTGRSIVLGGRVLRQISGSFVGDVSAQKIPKGATVDLRSPTGYRFGSTFRDDTILLTEVSEVGGAKNAMGYPVIKRVFFKPTGPMTSEDKIFLTSMVTGKEPPGLKTMLGLLVPVVGLYEIYTLADYAFGNGRQWLPVFQTSSSDGRYLGQYVIPRAAKDQVQAANGFVASVRSVGETVSHDTKAAALAASAAATEIAKTGERVLQTAGSWGRGIAYGAVALGATVLIASFFGPQIMAALRPKPQ